MKRLRKPVLEKWSTSAADPYVHPLSPAYGLIVLGEVRGREGFADGTRIQTAPIRRIRGRGGRWYVETASGTTYRLGTVDPEFVAWCAAEKIPFDPAHPIRRVTPEELAARELEKRGVSA